jgi:hypothetical protein
MRAIVYLALNKQMKQLEFVLTHFSDSREYLKDGYYRVQDFGDDVYELEFSTAGYCGTFDSHPAIKFRIIPETKPLLSYFIEIWLRDLSSFSSQNQKVMMPLFKSVLIN